MSIRILHLQRIIPHYRTGFFKLFHDCFPDSKIFYGQPYENESLQNASGLDCEYYEKCRNIYFERNGKIFISNIYSKLVKFRPNIVIAVFNVGNLNIYILLLLRKIFKFKIILWSFGYDPATGFNPDKNFSDKMRLYLSQKADAVIFYWENGKQEVSKFSKKTGHYFVAPNTLDTNKMLELKRAFDKTGKEKIKSELNVKVQFHFLYIGRLLKDKQMEILLKAFKLTEENFNECRLTVIGEGPEKNNLINLSEELKIRNIHFAGEILDEEQTGKWIYISDAFIMPGRLGLSVVHSFCFGTPVISQKKDSHFHGEGIGYLKKGVNGLLCEDGNEFDLYEKMISIISDKELSAKLREGAFHAALNECNVEKMIEGFKQAVYYAVKSASHSDEQIKISQ